LLFVTITRIVLEVLVSSQFFDFYWLTEKVLQPLYGWAATHFFTASMWQVGN